MSVVETCPPPTAATQLSDSDIELLDQELANLTPAERITAAQEQFAGQTILTTSFGPTAPVLLKLVAENAPDIPVATIRHHHETLRTLELVDWYRQELDLDLRIYDAPALSLPPYGSQAFFDFQRQVKIEPFQELLDDLQPEAYFTGVMRWQTAERADFKFVQHKGAAIAINPVLDMTQEEVDNFFAETDWPKDEHYFDPTKGRAQNAECGLHTTQYERNVS